MHRSGPLSLTFEGPENKVLGVKIANMAVRENLVQGIIQREFFLFLNENILFNPSLEQSQ